MAGHYRANVLFDRHSAIVVEGRTKEDARCNLELLREHEGGATMSIDEVQQRLVEQNDKRKSTDADF